MRADTPREPVYSPRHRQKVASNMGLSEVSNILWRERQLLQLLLFKLKTEQLMLTSGETRFLADATREVEMVINELKESELLRAVAVDALAAEMGLGPSPSLRELAAVVPAPWDNILDEHRKAFLADTQEIFALAQMNRELLSNGHKAAREALEWLTNGQEEMVEQQADAYSANGSATHASQSGAKLVDTAG
jgi:hypothetical protein